MVMSNPNWGCARRILQTCALLC